MRMQIWVSSLCGRALCNDPGKACWQGKCLWEQLNAPGYQDHSGVCGPASGLLAHDAGALAASDTQRILKPFVMVISPSAEDSGKAQGSGEAMGSCRGGSSVWPLLPSPREVADALGPESSAKKSNGLDDEGKNGSNINSILASSREHYSLVNAFMKRGVPIL